MTPLDVALAAGLKEGSQSGRERAFLCTQHDDHHESLFINGPMWFCGPCGQGGNAWKLAAFLLDVDPSDKKTIAAWLSEHGLIASNGGGNTVRTRPDSYMGHPITIWYDYTDGDGNPLYSVARVQFQKDGVREKEFPVFCGGSWGLKEKGIALVPYRLTQLITSNQVWIVEGEKDVHSLERIGLAATTNPGGAGKWKSEFSKYFRANQHVIILPDNDEVGRGHAQTIASSLLGMVASVKVVHLPGVPEKGDVTDWLNAGGTRDELDGLSAACPEFVQRSVESRSSPLVTVKLSDVPPVEVRWVWQNRIASGKLCLLIGDPGNGKSTLSLDIASRISKGAAWPDGGFAPVGSILILSAEDGVADTIRPRVDLQGGNPESVHVVQGIKCQNSERLFNLALDLEHLEGKVVDMKNVRLLIIDPLSAYLGEKDSYKDSEIRTVLAPLAAVAERHGIAVVGICHMNKDGQRRALYRALGSIAFVAAARTVFAVGVDKDDADRRIFVCVKNNLARKPPALAYRISDARGLEWEAQPLDDVDADSVLSGAAPEENTVRREAEEFLRTTLRAGEVAAKEIMKSAGENGIAETTLKRAKSRLGVRTRHAGQPGKAGQWFWYLPENATTSSPKDVTFEKVTSFEQVKETIPVTSVSSPKGATLSNLAPFGGSAILRDQQDRETFET
jgi:hypothetical protein